MQGGCKITNSNKNRNMHRMIVKVYKSKKVRDIVRHSEAIKVIIATSNHIVSEKLTAKEMPAVERNTPRNTDNLTFLYLYSYIKQKHLTKKLYK